MWHGLGSSIIETLKHAAVKKAATIVTYDDNSKIVLFKKKIFELLEPLHEIFDLFRTKLWLVMR